MGGPNAKTKIVGKSRCVSQQRCVSAELPPLQGWKGGKKQLRYWHGETHWGGVFDAKTFGQMAKRTTTVDG